LRPVPDFGMSSAFLPASKFGEGDPMDMAFWLLFLLGAFCFGALFAFVVGCDKV
jgi:hypothetical protein